MSEGNPVLPIPERRGWTGLFLDGIEWAGNKLPDPAALFLIALVATWLASAALAPVAFSETDPRSLSAKDGPKPIEIKNQLSGQALATFLARMVRTFVDFPPLGLVLVAMLGVGVAEHTGFINALLKALLSVTPRALITPMLILVGIVSHTAGDSGYVLVIPLGGVIFYAAGRHPVAGIAAAFAAVAGGFSANVLPSGLDPLLAGFTLSAAQIVDPAYTVNPLCNYIFTASACLVIIGCGWVVTDYVIEPRLRNTVVDGNPEDMPRMDPLTRGETRGLLVASASVLLATVLLALAAWPADSPLRGPPPLHSLTAQEAPLMQGIIPLIFLLFLLPGIVHGYVAGTVKSHRDIVKGMTKAMSTMGYYLVMAFFAAQFTYAFRESNLGVLVAVKGADLLKAMAMPDFVTVLGIILLTALVNLLIGSASAKWAILGPVFVPMLMQLGLAPEFTQAAYRIGDSTANIVTPLLPYFPLIVVFCQRYVKKTGVGSLLSLMVPYSVSFLVAWTALLFIFWQLGLPLGADASYVYPRSTP